MHLLFWLSLIPFATSWIGDDHINFVPVIFYGFILFMSGISYHLLHKLIIKSHKDDQAIQDAFNRPYKGIISMGIYLLGIALCFVDPLFGIICYVIVAVMWVVPNKRVEETVE